MATKKYIPTIENKHVIHPEFGRIALQELTQKKAKELYDKGFKYIKIEGEDKSDTNGTDDKK